MKAKQQSKNKKDLNKSSYNKSNMKRGLDWNKLNKTIKESQKNPEFIKELNKFIKATTRIYKLY